MRAATSSTHPHAVTNTPINNQPTPNRNHSSAQDAATDCSGVPQEDGAFAEAFSG
ncbi:MULTISPECIES: hypothetical protein [unclassified Streptomyces]|uniref:hypothetical protein n=1 Tax=unclassified Streptomyces TaxID=2593676 RepID=UPI0036F6DA47